jgi:dihydroorotate dehydrogenase
MWNSLGMPGEGLDQLAQDIPELNDIAFKHRKEIVYNVAPVTDDPVEESVELVRRTFDAGAKAVLLNAGCPNVIVEESERHAILCYDPKMLGKVLWRLAEVGVGKKYPKIFLRTSPYPSFDKAKTAYRIIENSKAVSAVWTPNSWGGLRPPEDENGNLVIQVPGDVAGKTGPATAGAALNQAKCAVEILNGSGIQVVSSGGIANCEAIGANAARQLKSAMKIGAVAGAGTTFFYASDRGWEEDVHRTLVEFDEIS